MSEDDNRGPAFRSFLIVMIIVMVIALALRLLSRSMLPKAARNHANTRFWWDDFAALASTAVAIGLIGIEIAMVNAGFGRHVVALAMDPSKILYLSKMNYIGNFVYDIALFLSKISALLFLMRVFPQKFNPSWFNFSLWAVFGLNIAWLIGAIFGTVFLCTPISKNWISTEPGHCGTEFNLLMGSVIPNVIIDLCILLLPLPKLWHLKIDAWKKFGMMVTFILGYCVIVVSLGRLITVTTSLDAVTADFTYQLIPVYYWASAEVPVTILSISLPAMLPLGRYLSFHYFSPVVSILSSFISTMSRSTKRSAPGSIGDDVRLAEYGNELVTGPHSNEEIGVFEDTSFRGRQGGMASGSRGAQDTYTAHVLHDQSSSSQDKAIPQHAIRVDNDVSVARHDI